MCQHSESCDASSCAEALKLLNIQRHDFMNHLQIIHSLVQMGRMENALSYIEKISKEDNWISNVRDEYNKC